MAARGETNYLIDVALFITGLVCTGTGILLDLRPHFFSGWFPMLKALHVWIGYIVTAVVAVHLLIHAGWIAAMTRGIFRERGKACVLVAVVLLSLAVCYLAACLGARPQSPGGLQRRGMPDPDGGRPPYLEERR